MYQRSDFSAHLKDAEIHYSFYFLSHLKLRVLHKMRKEILLLYKLNFIICYCHSVHLRYFPHNSPLCSDPTVSKDEHFICSLMPSDTQQGFSCHSERFTPSKFPQQQRIFTRYASNSPTLHLLLLLHTMGQLPKYTRNRMHCGILQAATLTS